MNRQIKADNNLLCELKAEVKHLEKMAKVDTASLAGAMEKNKSMMIIIRYQIIFNARQLSEMKQMLDETLPMLRDYHGEMKKLNPLQKQMKALHSYVYQRLPWICGKGSGLFQDCFPTTAYIALTS